MTLQKQTVAVPLKGLNLAVDPKNTEAGTLDLVGNMFFGRSARGGAELRKRYGGAALTRTKFIGSGSIIAGGRLASYRDERMIVGSSGLIGDPDSLYSFSPTAAGWREPASFTDFGQASVPSIGLTLDMFGASGTSYVATDVAVNAAGTLMAVAWKEATGNFLTNVFIVDLVTGATVGRAGSAGTGLGGAAGWVRVIALASSFMILMGSTAGTINSRTVAYATPSVVSASTLVVANMNASCKADVIRNGSNDSVLLAYHSTVPDTKILIWNSNLTSGGSTSNAEIPSQALGWVNWDFSDANGYLAFVSAATGAKVFTVAQAGPAVSATTTMDGAVTAAANVTGYKTTTSARYHVFIEVRAAATYNALIRHWPGSGTTTAIWQRSVGLAAACFQVPSTGRYYLPVTYDSSLQSAYYALDVSSPSDTTEAPVVMRALYGLGGGLSAAANLSACAAISTTVIAYPVVKLLQNPTGTKSFGVGVLRMDFAAKSISGAKSCGEDLHIPGGPVRQYDGRRVVELGYYVFPEVPSLAPAAGGALTLLGSYQYTAVYAWSDARGQWHRSAPSPIASVTLTGANNQVGVTLATLRLGAKDGPNQDSGYIELYRTVASGTTFYLVTRASASHAADTILFNDTASDAVIQQNEILYTTGKVLPRIGPPHARLMEVWRNRLFLAGTENPNELWVSNEYSFGLGGVSFSDALVVQMETDGGPITALCEMDDRLVIFKRSAVYVLAGNGPTLTGDNPFQQPTKLTSIVGAIDQRGIVKTRDGVMFVSIRGIYLLSHSGQLIYVGLPVEVVTSTRTVTGACVVEDEEQVRFVTAQGLTLVYHYGFPNEEGIGLWTEYTNQAAVDCIVWNGTFVYLQSDGTVVEETMGAYSDPGGASITASVRLAWLSLTQFFGRFKLYQLSAICDILSTFTLNYRLSYDFVSSPPAETGTKAVTAAGTTEPIQLSPARRRATAIQPYLDETSTTAGFRLSGWGLEVGLEPGAGKFGTEKFFT